MKSCGIIFKLEGFDKLKFEEDFKRMTFEQKIEEAKKQRIYMPDNLLEKEIVGVYGFFATKGNERRCCFYIGKATNIVSRLLGAKGHLHYYLKGKFSKLVPGNIKKYLDLGYDIEVEILDDFDDKYKDTEFSRAAHRLALAEIQQIVKYQELGQCLEQLPEGVGKYEKKYWERRYKKNT